MKINENTSFPRVPWCCLISSLNSMGHDRSCTRVHFCFTFLCYFLILKYFQDSSSNIQVFCQNNMFFELLQQKPCRIIQKFHQKPYFESETCQIGPKVGIWTCPDLPRPVQEDKSLSAKQVFAFIFLRNYTSPFVITRFL